MMQYILDRLKEPSTYSGIAALIAGFGLWGLNVDAWSAIFGAIASIAGAASIVIKEKGGSS